MCVLCVKDLLNGMLIKNKLSLAQIERVKACSMADGHRNEMPNYQEHMSLCNRDVLPIMNRTE